MEKVADKLKKENETLKNSNKNLCKTINELTEENKKQVKANEAYKKIKNMQSDKIKELRKEIKELKEFKCYIKDILGLDFEDADSLVLNCVETREKRYEEVLDEITCLKSDSQNEVSQAEFDDAMKDKDEEIKDLKDENGILTANNKTLTLGQSRRVRELNKEVVLLVRANKKYYKIIKETKKDRGYSVTDSEDEDEDDFDEPSECMSCDKKFCMFAASQGFHKMSYNKYFGSNQDDGDLCEKCILKVKYNSD